MFVLEALKDHYSICKLAKGSRFADTGGFAMFARTDKEVSLVCRAGEEPESSIAAERGWRALRVRGNLDFGMTGVLAGIAAALADKGISVCAVSTYDTDWFFVKAESFDFAVNALINAGYYVE